MLQVIPTYTFEFTINGDPNKICYRLRVSRENLSSMFDILIMNGIKNLKVTLETC